MKLSEAPGEAAQGANSGSGFGSETAASDPDAPSSDQDQNSHSNSNSHAERDVASGASVDVSAGGSSVSGQATATTLLSPDAVRPVAGEVRAEGFVFSVNPDGETVSLAGWYGTAQTGDVSVPSEVRSGEDAFAVTRIGVPGEDGKSAGVLAGSEAKSLSIPATVSDITEGALSDCPTLERVSVSKDNESYASFDGMLFSKDLSSLLLVPEGKRGAAQIPDPANSVPAGAFSRALGLQSAEVGEGSSAFSSWNGVLYSKDMKTLVACPPGAASAVVILESVEVVASKAFAGCQVFSITVLGSVREITADAFDASAKFAVVALPAGDDYDARKAVWEAAGFSEFAEPAKPGDTTGPSAPEGEDSEDAANDPEGSGAETSGLAYTLLDDYTLSVAWTGPEDPNAELEIPASAELHGVSYRVSGVAPSAFKGRASLRSVKLPVSVTTIGDNAFADCSNLASVDLPDSLRTIGASAFESTAIADLWLPASLQSVGPRALASCPLLQRVVALGSPEVAPDALAECAGVTVYCPSASAGSWNVGLPAAGNHLAPYGVTLPEAPLALEVGQSSSLFGDGDLQAPDSVETAYSYFAKPVSVDEQGLVTAKAAGTSDVSVSLTLDNQELARATRTVEVVRGANSEGEANIEAVPIPISRTLALSDGGVAPASVGGSFTSGNLTYTVLTESGSTGTVSVRATNRATISGELTIPSSVSNGGKSYTVTTIEGTAFYQCKKLSGRLSIPSTIIEIKDFAFTECTGLTGSLVIPDSVKVIGGSAFGACTGLSGTLTLPKSLKTIGEYTFNQCSGLKGSLAIPSSVTSIGDAAFQLCSGITSVSLPSSLTSVGNDAFRYCSSLSGELEMPSSVIRIGDRAFDDCSNLSAIIDSSTATLGVNVVSPDTLILCSTARGDAWVKAGANLALVAKYHLAIHSSPSGSVNNSYYDVAAASKLISGSLRIPQTIDGYPVKIIEENGFKGCSKLTGSLSLPSTVTAIKKNAFDGCTGLTSVTLPSSLTAIGDAAFQLCIGLKGSVAIPNSVKTIGEYAFSGNSGITGVSFGTSVTDIGRYAFNFCTSLSSMKLPSSVKTIGDNAFARCKFTEVAIPASVTAIGANVFDMCTSLSLVTDMSKTTVGAAAAPANVPVYCGNGNGSAWTGAGSKMALNFSLNAAKTGYAVGAADKTISGPLTIPSSFNGKPVVEIADNGFNECANLTGTLSIPSSIKKIGFAGFQNCTGFTGPLTIPDTVTDMERYAFQYCSGFSGALTLPKGLTTLKVATFAKCTGITSVAIPPTVTVIEGWVFWTTGLTGALVIPSSVTSIGENAIRTCEKLEEVLDLSNASLEAAGVAANTPAVFYCAASRVGAWKNIGYASKAVGHDVGLSKSTLALGLSNSALSASPTLASSKYFKSGVSVNWSTSNASIAGLSATSGTSTTVMPKGDGAATVTANMLYNGTVMASSTCAVTVDRTCTVSFDSNGGSTVTPKSVAYNGKLTAPTAPTKSGYTFSGWYKEESLSTAWNFGTDTVTNNITLYAKWTANLYTARFVTYGGSIVPDQTVEYAQKVPKPKDPTKTGHTFAGWYKESAYVNVWDFNVDTMWVNGITLHAKWVEKNVTVAYDAQGGSAIADQIVPFGGTAERPANPIKSGYIFAGWYKDVALAHPFDFTSPINEDLTLYAKWTLVVSCTVPKSAMISIDASGSVSTSSQDFVSSSVEALRVTAVSSEEQEEVSSLFPDDSSRTAVRLTLVSEEKQPVSFGLAGTAEIPLAAGFTIPAEGILSLRYSIEFPKGIRVDYSPGLRNVATLAYTVEAAG